MTLIPSRIYQTCLEHHAQMSAESFSVPNSIPIPFFGNVSDYFKSPVKILTAALNPSDKEFPASGRARFDVALGNESAEGLELQLSKYFETNPYSKWFNSFEPVLNGLDASYGGKMSFGEFASLALHLDMCSPIATSPTWSALTREEQECLTPKGKEIFEDLLAALKPDLIVGSVGWGHLSSWSTEFSEGKQWASCKTYKQSMHGKPLRVPLKVQSKKMLDKNGRGYLFVMGSAADTPFGRFSKDRKIEVGRHLHDLI